MPKIVTVSLASRRGWHCHMRPQLGAVRGCHGSALLHRPLMQSLCHLGCWLWGTPGCRVPFTQPLQRSFDLTPPKVWLQPLEVTADLQLHRQSHLWRGGWELCSWLWAALPQPAAKPLLALKTSTRKICHPQPFPIIPVPC